MAARLRTLPAQDQAKILTSMVVQLAKIVLVTKGAAAGVKAAAGAAEGSAETLAQLMNWKENGFLELERPAVGQQQHNLFL